jgi:hypothetical protein
LVDSLPSGRSADVTTANQGDDPWIDLSPRRVLETVARPYGLGRRIGVPERAHALDDPYPEHSGESDDYDCAEQDAPPIGMEEHGESTEHGLPLLLSCSGETCSIAPHHAAKPANDTITNGKVSGGRGAGPFRRN